MRTIRPSVVFSVGERMAEMGKKIQLLGRTEGKELSAIRAFVHVGADGRVVQQRTSQEDRELGFLESLAAISSPVDASARLQRLLDEDQGTLLGIFEGLAKLVRSRERIARASEAGLRDSGRNFVYLLIDALEPMAVAFAQGLIRLSRKHGFGIAKRYPLSLNLVLFLPSLFGAGQDRGALASSHAFLSDLERLLTGDESGAQVVSCKVWIVGSLDRYGNAVEGYQAMALPAAHFLRRFLDGVLDRDESWMNELDGSLNQRHTFLSSFGQAALVFPRRLLEEAIDRLGWSRLLESLFADESEADPDEIAGLAQAWIRDARLTGLVDRLYRGVDGQAIYRDPGRPEIDPAELELARFEPTVIRLTEREDPEWGIGVQRAGSAETRQLCDRYLAMSASLVDRQGGLARGRTFAEHLAGAGVSEATVGIRVLSLENLILDLQGFFARHADIAGDPERLIELNRSIPGKIDAIERLREKAASARVRVEELKGRVDEAQVGLEGREDRSHSESERGEPVVEEPDEAEESPADPAGAAAEERPGVEAGPETAESEEVELVPVGRPGEVAAESAYLLAADRLGATLSDLEELTTELDELVEEREEQTRRVAETRRLACDPTRRDALLASILEHDEPQRQQEREALGEAVSQRPAALDRIRQSRRKLRREAVIYLLVIPALGLVPLLLLPFVGWAAWLGILAVGALKVLPSWLGLLRAKAAFSDLLRSIRLRAEQLWRGRLERRRLRFEFLVHSEATTVLERLQEEVLLEESRLDRLEKLLGGELARAAQAWSDWRLDDSIYERAIMESAAARSMLCDDSRITHSIREVADELSRSALLTAFRQRSDGLPSPLEEAHERLRSRCGDYLTQHDLAAALEEAHGEEPERLGSLWRSVQTAASAWALVDGEPPPGTLRRLVFYPRELSPEVLEGCVKRNLLEDGAVEWIRSSDRDTLSVCEMWVGFPTHLVNELRPEAVSREEVAELSIDPEAFVLSLPPDQDELDLPEGDAYAMVQAALSFVDTESGGSSRSPDELFTEFSGEDFLPDESVDELLARLQGCVEIEPGRRSKLESFVAALRGQRRLQARKLFSVLL